MMRGGRMGYQHEAYRRDAGIVLVIVLWLLALLSLLAVAQTAMVRTETMVVANLVESARARAAAYGGIQLGLLELLRTPQARIWQADGTAYPARLGDAELRISLVDEAGKVDLNFATGPLFDALLRAAEMEESERQSLLDAILDWRDPDQLRRASGAEQEQYQAAGLDYGPRNGPFQSIEELSLVLGMNAPLYHLLEDSITVHSGNASVNSGVVSGQVMKRLLGGEGRGLTLEPSGEEPLADALLPAVLVTQSGIGRAFTIRCAAQLPSGVGEQLEAVVRLTPARGNSAPLYEILVWREGAPNMAMAVGE